MRRILLYLTLPASNNDLDTVSLVADLVEYASASAIHARALTAVFGIVADLDACLEVGLPLLGRTQIRTVEDNERQDSPLRIFAYRPEEGAEESSLEALRDLSELGAVEGVFESGEVRVSSSRSSALAAALEHQSWDTVVVFGLDTAIVDRLQRLRDHPSTRVVNFSPEKGASSSVDQTLPLRNEDDEELADDRRRGGIRALQFEELLTQLELEAEEPEDNGNRGSMRVGG